MEKSGKKWHELLPFQRLVAYSHGELFEDKRSNAFFDDELIENGTASSRKGMARWCEWHHLRIWRGTEWKRTGMSNWNGEEEG
jgi:hypothetical protein